MQVSLEARHSHAVYPERGKNRLQIGKTGGILFFRLTGDVVLGVAVALAADALAVVLARAELAVVAVAGEVIALAEIAGDDLKWLQS